MRAAYVLVHSVLLGPSAWAPEGWGERPCGYLLFGPPYDVMAREARERGWDVDQVPGGHLHQLVDPDTVTSQLVAMTAGWLQAAD